MFTEQLKKVYIKKVRFEGPHKDKFPDSGVL